MINLENRIRREEETKGVIHKLRNFLRVEYGDEGAATRSGHFYSYRGKSAPFFRVRYGEGATTAFLISVICFSMIFLGSYYFAKRKYDQSYGEWVQNHLSYIRGKVKSVTYNSFPVKRLYSVVPCNYAILEIETNDRSAYKLIALYKQFKEGENLNSMYFKDPDNDGVISFEEIFYFHNGVIPDLIFQPDIGDTHLPFIPQISEKARGILLD